ncbi:MAG: ATP-binding protein [Bryobacterales bacterium]|nr:ATP-binding protein [Bryobacterales bacterium]
MTRLLKISRRQTVGIVIAAALIALTFVNWADRGRFKVPEDGVNWIETEAGVVAASVVPQSPAALVGVRPGDTLRSVNGLRVLESIDVARILSEEQSPFEYVIERDRRVRSLDVTPAVDWSPRPLARFLLALGCAFALIGAFVWTRTPASALSTRFFGWCLASLAVFSLSASGRLEGIDRIVYWVDVWALLLMPPLMLDFLLRFPTGELKYGRLSRFAYGIAVATGVAHHAAAGGWVSGGIGEEALQQFFDTVPLVLLGANAIAVGAVWRKISDCPHPVQRQQIRWIGFGGIAGIAPFTVFYVVPFTLGLAPGPSEAFSVLSLAALPIGCAVALFQYRLLDFEPLWRRTLASALSGGLLLAAGYTVVRSGVIPGEWLDRYAPLLWLASVLLATIAYVPIRDWLLDAFERRAYRERYLDRRNLSAFARELAAETDADSMLEAVATRLERTLEVECIAILAPDDDQAGSPPERFSLLSCHGLADPEWPTPRPIPALAGATRTVTLTDRSGMAEGDPGSEFWHFVPCTLRGRIRAWIALGRTRSGTLLSGEDLALVETVAYPLAIALDNARLYRSLQEESARHQRLKEFNENIVESLSVGIIVTDTDGTVLSWNSHLELSLNVPRERAVGRPLGKLLPSALVQAVEGCTDESGSGSVEHFRLRASEFPAEFRPQGSDSDLERVVNLAVAPLVAKDFRRIGRLVIVDDVSERVELERAVRQADRLSSVGLLAAGVAHEVNTPLAVISSYTQMLADRFSLGSDEAHMLGTVTTQTFRASEIVNSLLDFSRISETSMVDCDLDQTVRDTLDLIRPQLSKAHVQVEADLSGGATVNGNKGRLQQVLLNLFLNARDAMPSGGLLRVSTHRGESADGSECVLVRVSDTGTGMSAEVRRRIFDPFFTTKAARRGTGLGLAVAYGIVQEHRGHISVESAPGAGTVFALEFPLAGQPAHA